MAGIQYSIKQNRFKKARMTGMTLSEDGSLSLTEGEDYHLLVLGALDSAITDCPWGRLLFQADFSENSVFYVYAAAANENVRYGEDGRAVKTDAFLLDPDRSGSVRRQFLEGMEGVRFINSQDVLLYRLTGRYLWIAIEVIGKSGSIRDMKVQAPGDNFMGTFPEIYREKNSFFHRYLSVFSSIYNDFQDRLDHMEELLELDSAPLELLELYAGWLGIDVKGGFLEEAALRALLKEAGTLIRWKGTKRSILRLCQLLLGETPVLVERSQVQEYVRRPQQEVFDRLYGDSPFDVTLLLKTGVDEKRKDQLLHLLRQFKPARSRLRIIFLEQTGILDSHSYLDQNTGAFLQETGRLDDARLAEGAVILE